MFSNTLSFLSSLNVSDQVSHPYKTTGKIIVTLHLGIKMKDTALNFSERQVAQFWRNV
jgi:hypothetical protein